MHRCAAIAVRLCRVVAVSAVAPLAVFGAGLLCPGGVRVRGPHGLARLPIARWAGPADRADACAVALARGPVLDIGCGPGRHLALLGDARVAALGIDACPEAVQLATLRGAHAVVGSVFEAVPGAGAYASALLLDGNIGIGGDPGALLTRVRELLSPDGRVVVEVDPHVRGVRVDRVRLERPDTVSAWFSWARVGTDAIARLAGDSGWRASAQVTCASRAFTTLTRER